MKKFTLLVSAVATIAVTACLFGFSSPKRAFADEVPAAESVSVLPGEALLGEPLESEAGAEANEVEPIRQTGIGLGINVLTASACDEFVTGYSVFSPEWLAALQTNKIVKAKDRQFSKNSITATDFLVNYSFGNEQNSGAENVLLGKAEAVFSLDSGVNFQDYSFKSYFTFTHVVEKYSLYITEYKNKNTYTGAFSADFLAALTEVQKGTMSVDELFARYGTHIVGSAVYGGRLDASFSLLSNKVVFNTELQDLLKASLSFSDVNTLNTATAYQAIKSAVDAGVVQSDLLSNFSMVKCGGDSIACAGPSDFTEAYKAWVASLNADDSLSVVMGYDDGLVGLWEILPDEYSDVAALIESRYVTEYQNCYNDFTLKFRTGDFKNFDGGVGDENDPYKISGAEQLENIEIDYEAVYELTENIDLGGTTWNSIGGNYRENYFTGEFYGNGHEISNFKSPSTAYTSNNRYYYGLFGAIGSGGVVKDLTLTDVKISFSGSNSDVSGSRIFIGALSGYCAGTVDGCAVKGNSCTYNKCASGTVYVGGLCGLASNATFKNCENNANVIAGRYSGAAGGISGYSRGSKFTNCKNTGTITAYCTWWGGFSYAGGIVGLRYNGTPTSTCSNCTNSGAKYAYNYSNTSSSNVINANDTFGGSRGDENFS